MGIPITPKHWSDANISYEEGKQLYQVAVLKKIDAEQDRLDSECWLKKLFRKKEPKALFSLLPVRAGKKQAS